MNYHHDFFSSLGGIWLVFGGLFMSLGVFSPKFRGNWGRRYNPGRQMSVIEQLLVALFFIGFGVLAIVL